MKWWRGQGSASQIGPVSQIECARARIQSRESQRQYFQHKTNYLSVFLLRMSLLPHTMPQMKLKPPITVFLQLWGAIVYLVVGFWLHYLECFLFANCIFLFLAQRLPLWKIDKKCWKLINYWENIQIPVMTRLIVPVTKFEHWITILSPLIKLSSSFDLHCDNCWSKSKITLLWLVWPNC